MDVKHETGENIQEYSLFWLYLRHATVTSDMQQLTLNMKLVILHGKYATYHVKFATSMPNMKRVRIFGNIRYFGFIQDMQPLTLNMQLVRLTCNN